jgi:hypothetical protein
MRRPIVRARRGRAWHDARPRCRQLSAERSSRSRGRTGARASRAWSDGFPAQSVPTASPRGFGRTALLRVWAPRSWSESQVKVGVPPSDIGGALARESGGDRPVAGGALERENRRGGRDSLSCRDLITGRDDDLVARSRLTASVCRRPCGTGSWREGSLARRRAGRRSSRHVPSRRAQRSVPGEHDCARSRR